MEYTPNQEKAINLEVGNLLILACAGSGKTEVVSRRIARLVSEDVPKDSIMAFTFMEKAAESLKTRIRRHLEEMNPNEPMLGDLSVGTIHSISFQILQDLDAKYRKFDVLDDQKQASFVSSNYYRLGLTELQGSYGKTINEFVNTLSAIHYKEIDIEDIEDEDLRKSIDKYFSITREEPYHFLDFNGIIDILIQHLQENPHDLNELQESIDYLFVDEYQDVDPRQEELINLLSGGGETANLCVVGDDDQSIYGWRGAEVENILTFEDRFPDVHTIHLSDNFRSTNAVVDIANSAIARLDEGERLEKEMRARQRDRDSGELVETKADDGDVHRLTFSNVGAEAVYIADRIEEIYGTSIEHEEGKRGICYGDIAVLFRGFSTKRTQHLTGELDDRGIPYIMRGSDGLFRNNEIRMVQAFFCLLADMDYHFWDESGDYNILDEEDIVLFIENSVQTLAEAGLLPNKRPKSVLEWIIKKRRTLDQVEKNQISIQEIFHEFLSTLGANTGEEPINDRLLYNFGQMSQLIADFETVHPRLTKSHLKTWVYFMSSWAAEKTPIPESREATVADAVNIQTIHKAKGLEWPAVFIPQISSHHLPSSKRNQTIDTYLDHVKYDLDSFAGGDVGERRLWYVALTRSEKFLELSAIDKPRVRPSPFFKEINHPLAMTEKGDPTDREYLPPKPLEEDALQTSYSDLKYYWECPHDYKLRIHMGFQPGIKHYLGYGKEIHRLLYAAHEKAMKGENVSEPWISELVEDEFSLRYAPKGAEEDMRNAASKIVRRYIRTFPDLSDHIIDAEKVFEIVVGNARINGTIDLLEKVDDTDATESTPVGVVDFKIVGEETDMDERFDDTKTQVRLYALAAREAFRMDPRHTTAYFLSPTEQERREVIATPDKQGEVQTKISKTVNRIIEGEYPRNPSEQRACAECDFYKICPGEAS